jgi:hypothetical protein
MAKEGHTRFLLANQQLTLLDTEAEQRWFHREIPRRHSLPVTGRIQNLIKKKELGQA